MKDKISITPFRRENDPPFNEKVEPGGRLSLQSLTDSDTKIRISREQSKIYFGFAERKYLSDCQKYKKFHSLYNIPDTEVILTSH